MAIDWKKMVGALVVILLVSGIVYITFGQEVKIRVDYDKSTIYVFENSRWIVGGREYNKLFDGTSLMYRRLSGSSIETILGDSSVTIKRTTTYIRGPVILDTYYFEGNITEKKMFPIYHKVEIYNGSGFFYRYEVRDLDYSGDTKSLDVTYMKFGKDISVEWDDGYRWARVYKSGILKVQYDIPSDYEVYNVRLFDPWLDSNYTNRTCWILSNPHASAETNVTSKLSLNMSTFGIQSAFCTDAEWGNQTDSLGYWNSTPCNNSGETNVTWWVNSPTIATDNTTQICMYYDNAADTTDDSDITTAGVFGDDFEDNNIDDWGPGVFYTSNPSGFLVTDGYVYGDTGVGYYGGHINISPAGTTTNMPEFRIISRIDVIDTLAATELGDWQKNRLGAVDKDPAYVLLAESADIRIRSYPGATLLVDDSISPPSGWFNFESNRDRNGFWYAKINDVAVNLDTNTSNTSYNDFRTFGVTLE